MSFIGLGLGLGNSHLNGGEPAPLTAPDLSGFSFDIPDVIQGTEITIPLAPGNSGGAAASWAVNNLSGASVVNQNFTYTADTLGSFNNVSVTATNAVDSDTSNTDSFTVHEQLSITTQLNSPTVTEGETATFTINVAGATGHQLEINDGGGWVNVPGATSNSYTSAPTVLSQNGTQYRYRVFGALGQELVSSVVTLTVNALTGYGTINVANFHHSRANSSAVNEEAQFDVNIRASRTTGIAPLGVAFEAVTLSNFPGITDPVKQLNFYWRKDRSGEFYKFMPSTHKFGRSAEFAIGATIRDVFPDVRTYNVEVMVEDPATGRRGYDTIAINPTSQDAESWVGSIFVSPSSDWTNAPAGATLVNTWDEACTENNQGDNKGTNGNARVLFNNGEQHDIDGDALQMIHRRGGIKLIRGYGDPNAPDPVWNVTGSGSTLISAFDQTTQSPVTMHNITIRGDFDAITGVGSTWERQIARFVNQDNCTLYQIDMDGMERLCMFDAPPNGGCVIVDCKATNWYNFGYAGDQKFGGIHAVDFRQKEGTIGGLNGKLSGEAYYLKAVGNSVSTLFTCNFPIGIADLATTSYNPDTQIFVGTRAAGSTSTNTEDLTELTLGVDYNFSALRNPGSEVEVDVILTTPHDSSLELIAFPRHFPVHGPVRTYHVDIGGASLVTFKALGGWSAGGSGVPYASFQPTIRNNSAGEEGTMAIFNLSVLEGGATVFHTGPANNGTVSSQANEAHNVLLEQCELRAGRFTESFVTLSTANSMERNNVFVMPDVAGANQYKYLRALVAMATWPQSSAAVQAMPYYSYNSTLINLKETQAPIEALANVIGQDPTTGSIMPTNVHTGNHLIFYPNDPVNTWADMTPLKTSSGQPLAGSAALDGGTQNDLVWDDILGQLRGATNSLGAYDTAGVALALSMTVQPSSQSVTAGALTTLTADATGTGSRKYQWYKNGSTVIGATSSAYQFVASETAKYRCEIRDDHDMIVSNEVTITVNAGVIAPVISGTFNIADGTAGDSYSGNVSSLVSGGGAATGWVLTGTPPTNLAVAANGDLSGTRVEETLAADSFGIQATNAAGPSNTLTDADGVTNSAAPVSYNFLETDGNEVYAEIGGQDGVDFDPGDKLIFEYNASVQGTYSYMAHRGQGGTGGLLNLRAASSNRWFFESSQADITIDTVLIANGVGDSSYFDNTWKEMEVTAKGGGFTVGRFFANNASNYFAGGVRNIRIDKSANGGGLTRWALDSGVTGASANESPTVDDNAIGPMTIFNAATEDWSYSSLRLSFAAGKYATHVHKVLQVNDEAEVKAIWDGNEGATSKQCFFGYFGSSPKIVEDTGKIEFDSRYEFYIDGVKATSGSTDMPTDGLAHTYRCVVVSRRGSFRRLGSSSGGEEFHGQMWDYKITRASETPTEITQWNVDSGSITTEAASIGSGVLTYVGFVNQDWSS